MSAKKRATSKKSASASESVKSSKKKAGGKKAGTGTATKKKAAKKKAKKVASTGATAKKVAKKKSATTKAAKTKKKTTAAASTKAKKTKTAKKTVVAKKTVKSRGSKSSKSAAASAGKNGRQRKSTARKKLTVDYSKQREKLLELRARLRGELGTMFDEVINSGDELKAPLHPAEAGSHSFEQQFTLDLISREEGQLRQIEAALQKFEDGTYGICEECGGKIPKARLEILPYTPYCVKCASKLGG